MTTAIPHCRSCGRAELHVILSLGRTPLANALLDERQLAGPEPTYPLDLAFCPRCSLVQILETVPPEKLFADYPYFSSFSDTMVSHAERLAARMVRDRKLGPSSLVMEAASNDGYLLKHYQSAGVPVLGIEPAANIAKVAGERHGVPTRTEFFTRDLAESMRIDGLRADVFHAHNVLAHVPDLNGFVAGIALILKEDGRAVIEAPYLRDLIDHCEFDTIYHEHLCYFSLTALDILFHRHGLMIADVARVPIHGGSLQLYVAHAGAASPTLAVRAMLHAEEKWGVGELGAYRDFAERVEGVMTGLRQMLHGLKSNGSRIAAYGASAKGSTLLNCCGIGPDVLDFVVDRSTVKQGRYTPGSRLRIWRPEHLLETMPDHVLLLTWNFADEVLHQQSEYRRRGGKFILPVPVPRVA